MAIKALRQSSKRTSLNAFGLSRRRSHRVKRSVPIKIFVEVISRHVQDLTVVDLPGLAYSDDTGGVRDVYHRIKTLYKQYIEDKHCVIACVVTATEDVNSQEAYTIAKEADPLMKRTIGVITKIDRIEAAHGRTIVQRLQGQGDNAWNFLLGTHAVRNRTQDEINSGASREDVDKAEEEFFVTHDYLSRVSAEGKAAMLGFSSLERKLVVVQSRIIKDALPGIERRIRQTLTEKNKELDALPPCVATDAKAQEVLRQLTGQLRECFQTLYVVDYSMIKSLDLSDAICPEDLFAVPSNAVSDMSTCSSETSSADVDSDGISTSVPDWLKMMPRIHGVLEEFEEEIRCAGHHIMTQGYAEKVRKELKDVVCYTLPDLKTESALESLASSEIGAFKKPTQDMLDKVHTYVSALCSVVVRKIFEIYHQLSDHVLAVVETMLEESLEKCREQLSVLLSIERGEPYTLNHYYSDTVTKVMARCDEVTIGETHQPSEAALQVLSSLLCPLLILCGSSLTLSFSDRSSPKAELLLVPCHLSPYLVPQGRTVADSTASLHPRWKYLEGKLYTRSREIQTRGWNIARQTRSGLS